MPLRLALVATVTLLSPAPAAIAAAPVGAPAVTVEPRRIEVALGGGMPAARLIGAGLDVVELGANAATLLEWPGDAATLAALGATVRIVDEHPGRTAALAAAADLANTPPPRGVHDRGVTAAPPYGSGSMGGFWSTPEIKAKLDDWVSGDTQDLVADKIDTIGTSREGRPIWGLEIGKHADGPDTRPAVFYNALTHAREPGGMLALCYFIDDLLAGYGVDPFATYLLEHRRIYVCPLVNPDGYRVNEMTYLTTFSFGLWRKNTRDNNGNGVFDSPGDGVDLNRNYGFRWGFDNAGSSGVASSETYRGPSAFSESETQAQRNRVALVKPKTGLSFHTYQDLLLHPWGYTTSQPIDAAAFHEWNDLLTRDNGYQSGQSGPLLYSVNGEFNDWCYGDTTAKPRAFTWTPEVGNASDNFWPSPSRIVPLARQNLRTAYVVAAIAGAFVQTDGWSTPEGALDASRGARLSVRARNLGLAPTSTGLTATITPLDSAVRILSGTIAYPPLDSRTSADPLDGAAFEMVVSDTVTPGRVVRFQIQFGDDDGLVSRDTLRVPLGTPTVVFADDASSGTFQWTVSGTWGVVQNDPAHLSRYFDDSPNTTYSGGSLSTLTLANPVDLSAGVHAQVVYDARWNVERDYDAGMLEASLDGVNWSNVRADDMTPGSGLGVQTAGKWFHAGSRWLWRTESADLSAFAGATGTAVRIRYRLLADTGNEYDGLSLDSLRILLYDPAAQPALVAVGPPPVSGVAELFAPSPNPAARAVRLEFALPEAGMATLEVIDLQGRVVRTLTRGAAAAGRYTRKWDLADQAGRRVEPGVYFVRLRTPTLQRTRRLVTLW